MRTPSFESPLPASGTRSSPEGVWRPRALAAAPLLFGQLAALLSIEYLTTFVDAQGPEGPVPLAPVRPDGPWSRRAYGAVLAFVAAVIAFVGARRLALGFRGRATSGLALKGSGRFRPP